MSPFSRSQRAFSPAKVSFSPAISFSTSARRRREASSFSFLSPCFSISSWAMRRRISSTSVGIESISMRSRLEASSTRSMALSGRKRSVM